MEVWKISRRIDNVCMGVTGVDSILSVSDTFLYTLRSAMIHCRQIDLLGDGQTQLLVNFKGFLTVWESQSECFLWEEGCWAFVLKHKVDLCLFFPCTSWCLGYPSRCIFLLSQLLSNYLYVYS